MLCRLATHIGTTLDKMLIALCRPASQIGFTLNKMLTALCRQATKLPTFVVALCRQATKLPTLLIALCRQATELHTLLVALCRLRVSGSRQSADRKQRGQPASVGSGRCGSSEKAGRCRSFLSGHGADHGG